MGLLDGLMGNASEVDASTTQTEFAQVSGTPAPLQLKFNKKLNIYDVHAVLASYVLR